MFNFRVYSEYSKYSTIKVNQINCGISDEVPYAAFKYSKRNHPIISVDKGELWIAKNYSGYIDINNNKLTENVIRLSGWDNGILGKFILDGNILGSLEYAENQQTNFYIELQRIQRPYVNELNDALLLIAKNLNIPVVATHPAYFIDDYAAQQCKESIIDGRYYFDNNRVPHITSDQYMMTEDELNYLWSDMPKVINNTNKLSEMINLKFPDFYYKIPEFKGDKSIVNPYSDDIYKSRFDYELSVIDKMGFRDYFLIVADFINWAKNNNIPVGPGRGSGAGSLVAFALNITTIDPVKYDLLFERFLNPERISMPDFDIDFCQDRRYEVINYVKSKYGEEYTASIATFGTMSSKSIIKDVGRALNISFPLLNDITDTIINTPVKSYSLTDAYDNFSTLRSYIKTRNEDIRLMWKLSNSLEDGIRNVGQHAAGIVISNDKLTNYCMINSGGSTIFDKDDLEEIGLVKFDFLGLKTLTVIDKVCRNYNIILDIGGLEDKNIYSFLSEGRSLGLFQIETEGLQPLLKELKPDCFNDIVALIALYRPGPIGAGMVDAYIRRKNKQENVNYFHDDLKACLESTYGVIVYQEQVMKIAEVIAGYSLSDADLLRRAMGKKKPEEMAKHKSAFIEGGVKNGYAGELVQNLFGMIAKFADYGFNKSHSVAYAYITYQTAWLKYYYPAEFMAEIMSSELGDKDKLYLYYKECIKNNIKILLPTIDSDVVYNFTAIDKNVIKFGLGSIKGITTTSVDKIIKNSPYSSKSDFLGRVNLNKTVINGLYYAGFFKEKRIEDWRQLLENEKKVIGFNITEHMFKQYNLNNGCSKFKGLPDKKNFILSGLFLKSKLKTSKGGTKFTILTIEDDIDTMDLFVFDKQINFKPDQMLFINGYTSKYSNKISFIAKEIKIGGDYY